MIPTPAAPSLAFGEDTGASDADGLTNDDMPVVVGTAEANATVELFDGAAMVGRATADGTGAYASTSDKLKDGAYALPIMAVDAAALATASSFRHDDPLDGPRGRRTTHGEDRTP